MTPNNPLAGEPIPGYRLIERIGRGGYGEVWKAEAPGGIMKAIKFVYGDIEDACSEDKSAEQELKALNRVKTIRHPFVLSLERFDIVQGQLLIVMELADRNMWDRYQECRKQNLPGIPRDELIGYLLETAEALDLMNNEYQLQHLDIKPQNLFLVHNHVKVADFGLAKDLQGLRATMTGGVTPLYAAPETFEGWISRFCDQYSLAIVFQELLTGERPFAGTNARHLMMQHLSAPPNLASLEEGDHAIIARALSKNPDDRFPSCMDFVVALRDAGKQVAITPAAAVPAPSKAAETITTAQAEELRRHIPVAQTQHPNRSQTLRQMPRLKTVEPRSRADSAAETEKDGASTTDEAREKLESGVLYPMIVIGLGGFGSRSLRHLRAAVKERFEGPQPTNLHLIHIDTDAGEFEGSAVVPGEEPLPKEAGVHIGLHRPAHYLKQGNMAPVESWHDAELLYKIPREGGTMGLRPLGRLAFCDQVRAVRAKLRDVLRHIHKDAGEVEFSFFQGLGLRSNFPGVHIITSLMGGTGSGAFIDLAYIVRQELKRFGFDPKRVHAHLFVPKADWNADGTATAGGSLVALRELDAFMSEGEVYRAQFGAKEEPVVEAAPPFDTVQIVPVEKPSVKNPSSRHLEVVSETLVNLGFTNLGRARKDHFRKRAIKDPVKPPPYAAIGLVRLTWPRRKLVSEAISRLGGILGSRWIEGPPVAEADSTQLGMELLHKRKLDVDSLRKQLEAQLSESLGGNPIDDLVRTLQRLKEGESLTQSKACEAVEELLAVFGSTLNPEKNKVTQGMNNIYPAVARDTETRLSEIVVNIAELPGRRFGFATKFLKHIDFLLAATLEDVQKRNVHAAAELETSYDQLLKFVGSLDTGASKLGARRGGQREELAERVLRFARGRLALAVDKALLNVLQSWKGLLPEFTRDVHFCKEQVRQLFEELSASTRRQDRRRLLEFPILPGRAKDLGEAADALVADVREEEWAALDERVQVRLRRECSALVKVCLERARYKDRFHALVEDELRGLMEKRLPARSATDLFMDDDRDPQIQHRELQKAFDEIAQTLLPGKFAEGAAVQFLGVPEDASREGFIELVADVLSDQPWTEFTSGGEIHLYCEQRYNPFRMIPGNWEHFQDHLKETDKYLFTRMDYPWFKGSGVSAIRENSARSPFADSVS